MLSHFGHVRLFATLWTVAHQAPLSMGFPRQEYWSGLLCPPSGDLPDPEMEPSLAGGFFTAEPPGKPILWVTNPYSLVSHRWACLVENHTRKVKEIHLSPISGITVFYGCKRNPQLQLVVRSLCHTRTHIHATTPSGPVEIQWEGIPIWRSADKTRAAGGTQPWASLSHGSGSVLSLLPPAPRGLLTFIPWRLTSKLSIRWNHSEAGLQTSPLSPADWMIWSGCLWS